MTTPPRAERRRLHIVDRVLQQWLLVALVVMQSVLLATAIWFLYRKLDAAVDENLYRVHFGPGTDMLSLLVREGLSVLGAMLLANATALLVADRIWVWYVNRILRHLGALIDAAARLDLRPLPRPDAGHAVLDQAARWRATEAAQLAHRRTGIAALPDVLPPPGARADAADILARLRE